jgi:hypothetical protein
MAGATTKTKRVELKAAEHTRGIHTAYTGDTALGRDDAGNAKQTRATAFMRGRADVDESTARMLRDQGVTKR